MTFPELPSLTVAHWYYNTTNNDGKRTKEIGNSLEEFFGFFYLSKFKDFY